MAEKAVQENLEETKDVLTEEKEQETAEAGVETEETVQTAEEEQAEENQEEKQETDEKEGGKFFKKKKDKKDQQIEELNDKYTRLFAEFDNFRNRTEKEKTAMFEVGAKAVIEKILPIIDSFERGLATVPEEEKESGFAEGMERVYKQLLNSLEEVGVKQIEALGQEFDPNLHNAVMHIEDENFGENIIAEEFLKGYMYRDTVVRHSMVKVAN